MAKPPIFSQKRAVTHGSASARVHSRLRRRLCALMGCKQRENNQTMRPRSLKDRNSNWQLFTRHLSDAKEERAKNNLSGARAFFSSSDQIICFRSTQIGQLHTYVISLFSTAI